MNDMAKSEIICLKDFFGLLPGQKLQDFANEVRELSTAEKHELAVAAARAMGWTQEQCAFTLEENR